MCLLPCVPPACPLRPAVRALSRSLCWGHLRVHERRVRDADDEDRARAAILEVEALADLPAADRQQQRAAAHVLAVGYGVVCATHTYAASFSPLGVCTEKGQGGGRARRTTLA
jgi:hypothetical protein